MYQEDAIHTCGQAGLDLTDPSALKDATSHGMRCIAQMEWTDGATTPATNRAMKLGVPCDTMGSKLCFQGNMCTVSSHAICLYV